MSILDSTVGICMKLHSSKHCLNEASTWFASVFCRSEKTNKLITGSKVEIRHYSLQVSESSIKLQFAPPKDSNPKQNSGQVVEGTRAGVAGGGGELKEGAKEMKGERRI